MNKEQIAKLKELAEKAIEKAPWPFYLAALDREATPEVILELIALAERAILAAAPAPIQKDPQAAQLVTTTYAKAHSTTVIVNLVKGNVTTCLYSADHSANGKTIGVSDLPDGLSLAVKQSPEPCGGCGETDPSKRCIGCCHPFSEPSPAVTMEPATPPALAGSQAQAAGDALDAARYRWLRDKARSVDWTRHLDANSYQIECRVGAVKMDTDIDAAMREQP